MRIEGFGKQKEIEEERKGKTSVKQLGETNKQRRINVDMKKKEIIKKGVKEKGN